MNVATDLIEREHEAIEACLAVFGRRAHRSSALDLCSLAERHGSMEDEVLYPALADLDQDLARHGRDDHRAQEELIDGIRHASGRQELRALVGELATVLRRHVTAEEREVLPALEDALGVSHMNQLGLELLDWQHDHARRERESEEHFEELLSLTRDELYERAREADLDGRSTMKKVELAEALADS